MSKPYSGVFAQHCEAFIAQKRAVGYRYEAEERQLRYFDEFSKSFPANSCLSKDIVETWVAIRPYEAEKSRQHRVTVIRELARFLAAGGHEAYILPPQRKRPPSNFKPYIFTKEEIAKLFLAAGQMPYQAVSPYIHIVMPVMLRMLYGCGLRLSEALSLRVRDIDLEKGVITVAHSKFDDSRMVPMSASLRKVCEAYAASIPLLSDPGSPFFPNRYGEEIGGRSIYGQYRKLLWMAGISHGGRGNGPRLHDLRHTFAVHAMRKLVMGGMDLYVTSPILSAYLGHKSLAATEKYLRLTAEVYPDIVRRFEKHFAAVVPGRYSDAD